MKPQFEVALLIPDLAPDRLSPADHIAAEVRFAAALEVACARSGGVTQTYAWSEALLNEWADLERQAEAPRTPWQAALAAAESDAWSGRRVPAGAAFDVRVVLALEGEAAFPDSVPF